jgi:CHAD domain-containing protein
VRVVLRRTVSLARLTQDAPKKGSGTALRHASRDLRRALGVRRTHDVSAGLLAARFRRDPRRRAIAARVAARLSRDAGEATSPAELEALLSALRREFAARDATLSSTSPLLGSDAARLGARLEKDIRRRLTARAKRLLARGVPVAENVHEARIDARDLRYGLEFARLSGVETLLPLLERFQEEAGRAHDRAELIALVRRTAGRLGAARRREAMRLLPPLLTDFERTLSRAQSASRALLASLKRRLSRW